MDRASCATDDPDTLPRAGDPSLCLNCGRILLFSLDLSLRAPTAAEIDVLMNDRDHWGKIELLQNAIRARGPLHT